MRIEHQCPQCGGPVAFEETDRLLACSFCKTNLYIQPSDYFRYAFSPAFGVTEKIVYIPYWRVRGIRFACRTSGIKDTLIDRTILAVNFKGLPDTLGVRPQAVSLKFADKKEGERYLEPQVVFSFAFMESQTDWSSSAGLFRETTGFSSLNLRAALGSELSTAGTEAREDKLYLESFVAEQAHLVYAPFFIKDQTFYDGLTGDAVNAAVDTESMDGILSRGDWGIRFLSTLCPQCGFNLSAERDSCVLVCAHCDTCWHAIDQGDLQALDFRVLSPDNPAGKYAFLPFWRTKVLIDGINLKSYGDLLRASDPVAFSQCGRTESDLYFWTPAFKIAPSIFLRTAHRMTLTNPDGTTLNEMRDILLYPANVSPSEAAQSLKVVLLDMMQRKQELLPELSKITITPTESVLVFYPFLDTGYELSDMRVRCGIMKTALTWGHNL